MFEVVMNRRADYGMREIDFFFEWSQRPLFSKRTPVCMTVRGLLQQPGCENRECGQLD